MTILTEGFTQVWQMVSFVEQNDDDAGVRTRAADLRSIIDDLQSELDALIEQAKTSLKPVDRQRAMEQAVTIAFRFPNSILIT